MTNEENESASIKASNPLTPQQDNSAFESIPVRPAPWSKSEAGSPMNRERALGMFRTANQWLYDRLVEGATCKCGNCYLCAYSFFANSVSQQMDGASYIEPYDKCAGNNCSECDGINCTCVHHALHSHSCPNCFHFFDCAETECATNYSASCPECNKQLDGGEQPEPRSCPNDNTPMQSFISQYVRCPKCGYQEGIKS